MLSDCDRIVLTAARDQRIRDLLPNGEATATGFDVERTLHVIALTEEHCLALSHPQTALIDIAWIAAGADFVIVWLATSDGGRQKFWEAPSRSAALKLMANDVLNDKLAMPTATAEPTTAPIKSATVADLPASRLPQPAPAQNLAEIASDLQQPEAEVLAFLASSGYTPLAYAGQTLLPPDAAIAAINHFSSLIGQRILERRGLWGLNGTAPAPAPTTEAVSTSRPKGTKPKAAPKAETNGAKPAKAKTTKPKASKPKTEAKQGTPARGEGGRFLPKDS